MNRCIFISVFLIFCFFCLRADEPKLKEKKDRGILTYFSFENDLFLGSDNYYTSGVFMGAGYASENFSSNFLPKFLGRLLDKAPGLRDKDKSVFSISIMDRIFTPNDISDTELIANDIPYSGQFVGNITFSAQNKIHLDAFTISIGITGPDSGSAEIQTTLHYLVESPKPNGWRYQIDNEILGNLFYEHRYRLLFDQGEKSNYDVLVLGSAGVGNIISNINFGIGFRAGYNIPDDFYLPAPLFADRTIGLFRSSFNEKDFSIYIYGFLDAALTAYTISLDGNSYIDSHRVSYVPYSMRFIFGVAAEFKGIHCNFVWVNMTIPWENPQNDLVDNYIQLSFYNLF
jgi:lipid A 3-O-deacylase